MQKYHDSTISCSSFVIEEIRCWWCSVFVRSIYTTCSMLARMCITSYTPLWCVFLATRCTRISATNAAECVLHVCCETLISYFSFARKGNRCFQHAREMLRRRFPLQVQKYHTNTISCSSCVIGKYGVAGVLHSALAFTQHIRMLAQYGDSTYTPLERVFVACVLCVAHVHTFCYAQHTHTVLSVFLLVSKLSCYKPRVQCCYAT